MADDFEERAAGERPESQPAVSIDELLQHSEFLGAIAQRLAADRAAAEDLVQDVWVKALSAPPASADNVRRWLATVLENTAHSDHRSRSSRQRRESATARAEGTGEASDAAATHADLRRFLAEAVLSLPEREREVVILRFYRGFSAERTAAHLDIAERTVRHRMSAAVEHLRDRLGDSFGSEAH